MVIFIKFSEMEEDGRRGKKVGIFRRILKGNPPPTQTPNLSLIPTSPPRERRPLRSVPTVGPQFKVDPEILAKDYVEKECKYIGTVSDVYRDFDSGNRAMILSLLDEKKKLGLLHSNLTWQHDVVMSFSAYNVKILRRDGEDLIHRIPTHHIAATGYVQDDSRLYLFIKFASEVNEEMCNLAFFCCENKAAAQEICFLTQQLFQLVYTNSTMDFFDKSIQDGALTPKHHSFSTDDSADKKDTIKLSLPSRNSTNGSIDTPPLLQNGHRLSPSAQKASTLPFSSTPQKRSPHLSRTATSSTPSSPVLSKPRWRSESSATSSLANPNYQQLQLNEYIEVLKERLTKEELQQFAEHLHFFRKGTLSIDVYCERLMTIYTEQRKSLLLGMRHFIPESKDRCYFEAFLRRHNIETGSDDVRWWDQPPKSRTLSETDGSIASTTVHIADLSSNSEHISPYHSSNDDIEDWKETIRDSISSTDKSSTLKKSQEVSLTSYEDEINPPPRRLYVNREDDGSPLIRSGQVPIEREIPDVQDSPERVSRQKHEKRKKYKVKSKSAVEFGAPIPSLATGGADVDLDSSLDKKIKRAAKAKKKEKNSKSKSDEVSNQHGCSKENVSVPNTPEGGDTTKLKFFKTKGAKVKEKKINLSTSTPDLLASDPVFDSATNPSTKQQKKEHRKKRKHKLSADIRPSTSAAFL